MKDALDKPRDLVVKLSCIAFLREDGQAHTVQAAWFMETSFIVLDEVAEKEQLTSPVIHSLN